jgi:hypothetical protein
MNETTNNNSPEEGLPQFKLKQLQEAISLLEDLSWRVMWAIDFARFPSIQDELDPLLDAIDTAQETLENKHDELEDDLKTYEENKTITLQRFKENNSLQDILN